MYKSRIPGNAFRSFMLAVAALTASSPIIATAQVTQPSVTAKKPSAVDSRDKKAVSKAPDVVIGGQVFVVTKGGTNVKLALVTVSAYLENEFVDRVNQTFAAEREARNSAVAELFSARLRVKEAIAAKVATDDPYSLDHKKKVNELQMEFLKEMRRSLKFVSVDHFVEIQGNPKETAKSDADGNFELSVPAGAYVLSARGTRMAGDETEVYEWLVKVDASNKIRKIMLSNDNLVKTKCSECVILPTDLPSRID